MQGILEKISGKENLTFLEAKEAMEKIINGSADDEEVYVFLKAFNEKDATAEEIAGFVKSIRNNSLSFHCDAGKKIIDTCGTGGDNLETFNTSTMVAFVASPYVNVAKHGSRAVTSRCGSADLLEELGVNIDCSMEASERALKETGLCFLHAAKYHPTLQRVAKIRKRVGKSVFNYLGPLCNPLKIDAQLLGVFKEDLMGKMALTLKNMGRKCIVAHGYPAMDEISICGGTKILHYDGISLRSYFIEPEQYGISRVDLARIRGGDKRRNAEIAMDILRGRKSPYRDATLINSSYAILIGGGADSMEGAMDMAMHSIDSGRALKNYKELVRITNL